MRAGKLRHRLTLQEPVHTQDPDTGAVSTAWVTRAVVWASIEPLSAREFIQSAATQSQVTTRIGMRHRDDVLASWRGLHRNKIYNFAGVLPDPESGLRHLTIPASEGVNEG